MIVPAGSIVAGENTSQQRTGYIFVLVNAISRASFLPENTQEEPARLVRKRTQVRMDALDMVTVSKRTTGSRNRVFFHLPP